MTAPASWRTPDRVDQILNNQQQIMTSLASLNRKADLIMSDQAHIDTDVAALEASDTAIATEIAALKAANPTVDFTGLDKAVTDAQALTSTTPPDAPTA